MMLKFWCFCLMLLSSLEGMPPARELYADSGEKVELFSSIAADTYKITSLYANGDRGFTLIAEWTSEKVNSYMRPEYIGKIYMDQDGSIWMRYVDQDDVGRYFIKYNRKEEGPEVKLNVHISRNLTEKCIREIQKFIEKYPENDIRKGWQSCRDWIRRKSNQHERHQPPFPQKEVNTEAIEEYKGQLPSRQKGCKRHLGGSEKTLPPRHEPADSPLLQDLQQRREQPISCSDMNF